jgi:cell division protein FtsB
MPPRRRRSFRPAGVVRPLLSLAALTAGLLVSGAFTGIALQQSAVQRDERTLQTQIAAEQARNADLQAQIEQRKTDSYVVDKARDLGYVRPGEGLIAIDRGPSGLPTVRLNASDGGRFARWWSVFFGVR